MRHHAGIALLSGCALFFPALACAQTVPTDPNQNLDKTEVNSGQAAVFQMEKWQTVTERQAARDKLNAVVVSGIQLLPVASIVAEENSNIFAAPTGQSDFITTLDAKLTAETTWSRNELYARFEANRSIHATYSSEDATQLMGTMSGRIDVSSAISISPSATWERLVEPRTSTGAPLDASAPVVFQHRAAGLDARWQGARITLQAGFGAEQYIYNDVLTAGQLVDQSDRDFTQYSVHARVSYDLGGDRQVFFAVEHHKADYREPAVGGITGRDSDGWQITTGLSSQITPLIRGRLGLGYLTERYESSLAKPVSAIAIDVALDWSPSEITTVHVQGTRQLENSSSTDAFGYLSTRFSLRADHELLRSLIVSLGGTLELDNFRSADRRDTLYSLEAGARYQLTRSIYLRGKLYLLRRDSSGADSAFPYTQRDVSLEIAYQF